MIHSTDVASAAFQHVHCSYGLYWPLVSLSWSFLVFHSQIRNLWEETLLSSDIVCSLSFMTYQTHLATIVDTLTLIFHTLRYCLLRGTSSSIIRSGYSRCSVDWPNSIYSDFQIFSENYLVLTSAVLVWVWHVAVVLLLWCLMSWRMCSTNRCMLSGWFSLSTLILFLLLRVHFHIWLCWRLCIW